MAISTQAAKSKGRKLQQLVRDKILGLFPSLQPDDVKSCAMGSYGEDVQLSPAARALVPFSFECKRYAKFSVYQHYDQAAAQKKGEPVAVIQADRRKPLAIVDLEVFLELVKGRD